MQSFKINKAKIKQASNVALKLLAGSYSASPMLASNVNTISPSAGSKDVKVRFTPANPTCMFRSLIEHDVSGALLKLISNHQRYFSHQQALPAGVHFISDEDAVNHNRFASEHSCKGLQLFDLGLLYEFQK